MNDRSGMRSLTISIAAVERDTGLSKDTLRVWERRYGFPMPDRDTLGERSYPLDQVERLRIIKRLLDAGHRPGRIVKLSAEDLQHLAEGAAFAPLRADAGRAADLQPYLDCIRSHEVEALRRMLAQGLLRHGLARFVIDAVAPLNRLIGDAWMRGHLEVFEEHVYTESMQIVLRNAINSIPEPNTQERPRVLLTTFPNEAHGLGLLMAEALFALDGSRCLSLGTQTPVWDIVLAATAHHADVVALSFTPTMNPNLVMDGLAELRGKLPQSIEVWAGGNCPVIHRRPSQGVTVLRDLEAIHPAVANWRATHL